MNLLGLDFGSKTIGVALCCGGSPVAVGVETLRRDREENLKASVHRIGDLIKEHNISIIVLGFPKNMDGTVSERCEKTLAFAERLKRTFKRVKIELQDERLTSVQAERNMLSLGVGRHKRRAAVDMQAAVIILQTYIDKSLSREED